MHIMDLSEMLEVFYEDEMLLVDGQSFYIGVVPGVGPFVKPLGDDMAAVFDWQDLVRLAADQQGEVA